MNVSQQYEEPAHHTIQLPANVAPKIYAQSIITRRESRRKEERKENEEVKSGRLETDLFPYLRQKFSLNLCTSFICLANATHPLIIICLHEDRGRGTLTL